jgi:hypothetical protein
MVLLMVITSALGGGKTTPVTAETPKDAEIKQLKDQIKKMGYKNQLETAQRQADKYTQSVKPPVDPKAKAKAARDAAIASTIGIPYLSNAIPLFIGKRTNPTQGNARQCSCCPQERQLRNSSAPQGTGSDASQAHKTGCSAC